MQTKCQTTSSGNRRWNLPLPLFFLYIFFVRPIFVVCVFEADFSVLKWVFIMGCGNAMRPPPTHPSGYRDFPLARRAREPGSGGGTARSVDFARYAARRSARPPLPRERERDDPHVPGAARLGTVVSPPVTPGCERVCQCLHAHTDTHTQDTAYTAYTRTHPTRRPLVFRMEFDRTLKMFETCFLILVSQRLLSKATSSES